METQQKRSAEPPRMADINMTPMIDVLLVLLVIFMLAQPLLQRSIDVQLPLEENTSQSVDVAPIVLEITADAGYRINNQPVPLGKLESRLREIYQSRPDKVLFIKAGAGVIYQDVITAMDAARAAGVAVLGAVLSN